MGLTRRRDSYYVEFSVLDDGKLLRAAPFGTGKLKRWKVGGLNRKIAKDHEAVIKTRLLTGQIPSLSVERAQSVTFRQWAKQYVQLEQVKKLRGYALRKHYAENLTEFFKDMPLGAIKPEDVSAYRAQRVQYRRRRCAKCEAFMGRRTCGTCGWERDDTGVPASTQTINHDHMTLIHMLNIAKSPQFRLVTDNPAAYVPKPNPQNERDRIANADEWERLNGTLAPHLRRVLTVAYDVGPRTKSELLTLEWLDVDMRRKEFTLRRTKNGEVRVVPMTPAVYAVFQECWKERRLDTNRVFLYNGKAIERIGTGFKAACRRAGVDTATAMKIVGHKSDRMHRRYNTIEPEDLQKAAEKLHRYMSSNTLITPEPIAVRPQIVSTRQITMSGRSSVVES